MSDPNEAPSAPPDTKPVDPTEVDPDTGTDPDGTPTENPAG